ncbi:PA0069 family radical SAM protein [Amaricoccus tamworthensis]|uniref:PA0069 family radical SAM protein n=1 Tax=Amaricoccus tamworthensis TaxID=57002 RepID=UPI003C7D3BF7
MADRESKLKRALNLRGRGSHTNPTGRFERFETVEFDDGWTNEEDIPPVRTEVATETPKSVIARNTSPDIPFDRSLNAYRGCEHGCVYCFARPSHAYLGLSPGLDFETKLTAKPNAAALLKKEIAKRSYRVATLAMGTNTDPYQPIERQLRITRQVLEVLNEWSHPVSIVTKGTLIEQDLDVIGSMAKRGIASVGISVTTLDPELSRSMEPRAPAPTRRLATISRLAEKGVPVRVMIAPVVPGLTDHELENILKSAREAGATRASYIALRLPREVSPLFQEWLSRCKPGYASRVMARVREYHDGSDYSSEWSKRMTGTGQHAQLLAKRFQNATKKLGYCTGSESLRCDLFKKPERLNPQMELF